MDARFEGGIDREDVGHAMGVVSRGEGIGRNRRWKEGENEAVERSMKRPENYCQYCLKSV